MMIRLNIGKKTHFDHRACARPNNSTDQSAVDFFLNRMHPMHIPVNPATDSDSKAPLTPVQTHHQ